MKISGLILTYNEELHIKRCIESLLLVCSEVVIVDSYSSDMTKRISESYDQVRFYENNFLSHSAQMNWALDNVLFENEWVFRLDADEVLSSDLVSSIKSQFDSISNSSVGISIGRRIYFREKPIRYGGIFPINIVRIFKLGFARCEDRIMDEHMLISGNISYIQGEIFDINLNSISWWIQKHNTYSSREALEFISENYILSLKELGLKTYFRRFFKVNVYAKIPLGFRSFLLFSYRYFLRLGFLDGFNGFAFHFLQSFWYRFLVDLKISEIKRKKLKYQEKNKIFDEI